MKIFLSSFLLLLSSFLFSVRALTLEACVDSALAHSPVAAAAALEAGKARILRGTAFDPPMTEVTLKQETTGGGGPENGVYFGQEFEFPTVYAARSRSLKARQYLAESRFDIVAAEVERDVASAYWDAACSRELLRLNAELDTVYAEFCRVAAVRLEQGEIGRLELMNAERAREKNAMERDRLQLDYDSRILRLRTLTGITIPIEIDPESGPVPGCAPVPWGAHNSDIFPCGAHTPSVIFSETLRGRLASREITLAEKELALARNELLPGIRLGATVQALIKGFNPYHIERLPFEKGNFMGFEVGLTVPLFFGAKSARIRAAEADRRIAELNMEAARADAEREMTETEGRLKSLESRLEHYRTTALPRADEIKRIAMVSYRLGDIDYMEYISNLEAAYSVYADYALCLNDWRQALTNLKAICR